MTEVSYLLVDRAKCPCDDQGPLGEGTNLMRRDFHPNADNTCKQRFPEVEMRHYYSPSDGLRKDGLRVASGLQFMEGVNGGTPPPKFLKYLKIRAKIDS